MRYFILFASLLLFANLSFAQTDSAAIKKLYQHTYTHYDSVHLARLNTSGNLMIAGGVGLCAAGSFLIYQGSTIYPSKTGSISKNHRQGSIYYAAGGIAVAGGIVLVALGARNKVDFKMQKKWIEFQSGILDNGHLGIALNF